MLNYYKFIGVLSLGLTLNVFSQKNEIYDHRELRKGQLGVGYTVFSSDTGLEKFDVKILGVMKNKWGPGKDLIIANLEHPRLEANGQVVAGMSGSPVYIDGKLLGAVGYGLGQFTDKPFAGITPAKDMLAILEAPSGLEARASYELDDLLKPIALPLAISGLGLSQSAKEFFGPEFRKRGFEMISGGFSAGNLGKTKNNNKLYPGGPVAVSFVTGAQNISGIGTVTWIGNKNGEPQWLAFGHPFNSEGATDLPVSSAEIITTVFSQSYSYKLGQALAPIGTMTRDNLPAIGGVIGQLPVMTDLSIEFENKNKMKKYNYQVTPKPDDSPLFIAAALAGVLNADVHKNAGGTYEFDIELIVDEEIGEQKIKFSRTVASDSKPLEPRVAKMIVADLSELLNQKFKKVFIKNIKIKIKKSDEIKWAKLKQVNFGFRNKVLDLLISYEPWQKELKKFKINFDLDKKLNLEDLKNHDLIIADYLKSGSLEKESNLVNTAGNYSELVSNFKSLPKDKNVCFYLQQAERGRRIMGQASNWPLSMRGLTKSIIEPSSANYNKELIKLGCRDLNMPVYGKLSVGLGD